MLPIIINNLVVPALVNELAIDTDTAALEALNLRENRVALRAETASHGTIVAARCLHVLHLGLYFGRVCILHAIGQRRRVLHSIIMLQGG